MVTVNKRDSVRFKDTKHTIFLAYFTPKKLKFTMTKTLNSLFILVF